MTVRKPQANQARRKFAHNNECRLNENKIALQYIHIELKIM